MKMATRVLLLTIVGLNVLVGYNTAKAMSAQDIQDTIKWLAQMRQHRKILLEQSKVNKKAFKQLLDEAEEEDDKEAERRLEAKIEEVKQEASQLKQEAKDVKEEIEELKEKLPKTEKQKVTSMQKDIEKLLNTRNRIQREATYERMMIKFVRPQLANLRRMIELWTAAGKSFPDYYVDWLKSMEDAVELRRSKLQELKRIRQAVMLRLLELVQ